MDKSYLSVKETAENGGVSERRVGQYCSEGRIPGAQRIGKAWAIPSNAEKPMDPRRLKREKASAKAEEAQEQVLRSGCLIWIWAALCLL